jgi:hypothetical protein
LGVFAQSFSCLCDKKEKIDIFARAFCILAARLWQLGVPALALGGTAWSTKVLSERMFEGAST